MTTLELNATTSKNKDGNFFSEINLRKSLLLPRRDVQASMQPASSRADSF